ncbi:patatin-like phospholipase family protein [Rhizobium aegyptiacum]|uniref:patatin-like phospholipase family protein n=1 Tax=Rhizobium aegyptiacum TaxID=1764550 RepID=UPI0007E57D9A|nr:patatin-like phospholipase family protein [Rhizobium aegyptiacum]
MTDDRIPTESEPSQSSEVGKIALFSFDEVRRFEIAAINNRRDRQDRPPVGPPINFPGRDRPYGGDFREAVSPLSGPEIAAIVDPGEIERRQGTTDPSLTRPSPVPTNMSGLALSGGGIRSAAFCLGAMQAFNAHDALDKFDYLSTVSGGGYIGAAVSAGMSENDGKFPFATGREDIRDSDSVGHLRNFSNYLMPRNRSFFRNIGEAAAILLRGIFCNAVMIAPILLIAALLSAYLWTKSNGFLESGFLVSGVLQLNPYANNVSVAALIVVVTALAVGFRFSRIPLKWPVKLVVWLALILVPVFVYAIFFVDFLRVPLAGAAAFLTAVPLGVPIILALAEGALLVCWGLLRSIDWYPGNDAESYLLSLCSTLLWVIIICTGLEGIPFLMDWMSTTGPTIFTDRLPVTLDQNTIVLVASVLAIAAAIAAWAERIEAMAESPRAVSRRGSLIRKLASKSVLLFAAAIFPVAFIAVFGWLAVAFTSFTAMTDYEYIGWMCLLGLLTAVSLALGPNSFSLHRFYRDRLKAAFLVKEALFPDSSSMPSGSMGELKLSKLNTDLAPYHLLNTALNLQGSQEANQRGREADFFTFSPQFVGSDLTFYSPVHGKKIGLHASTPAVEKLDPKLDMATVVAISGAAASANMGSATIRILSPTLAFLNVRLGYWLLNPRVSELARPIWKKLAGKFYLVMEMFGMLHEKSEQLYLTDGGHIENLGIYQLLKRGCQLIVAIDAEADPGMTFSSLLKLERFARIDLGVRIELPWQEITYGDPHFPHVSRRHPLGKGPHCAVGKITYPDQSEGLIVYVKSSVTGDERDYVLDYKRRYPAFPHEQTSDQFFTEEQFEVYRALGFHAVDRFMSRKDYFATAEDLVSSFPRAEDLYGLIGALLPGAQIGLLKTDTSKV